MTAYLAREPANNLLSSAISGCYWSNLDWLAATHSPFSSSSSPALRTAHINTNMASVLLRRHLPRTAHQVTPCLRGVSTSKRALQTSAVLRQAEPVTDSSSEADRLRARNLTDIHTVEDLQAMTPLDVLSAKGDSQMRHFTGMSAH